MIDNGLDAIRAQIGKPVEVNSAGVRLLPPKAEALIDMRRTIREREGKTEVLEIAAMSLCACVRGLERDEAAVFIARNGGEFGPLGVAAMDLCGVLPGSRSKDADGPL